MARNIQSIYSLKEESYIEIKAIIEQEIDRYIAMNLEKEAREKDI